eukprot:TRINITY_DN10928_c0_g1_i10.p1 TRINITY_DN10928_c0_g1~~TRINITY_DN10928_c0_g1_i10.p1  ORF type:complete len:151 (+),score=18.49 TRINITY_DN10928_c0_g1_i10:166-618(+)
MNLADNKEQDGGFQIVPGFHHHLERWAKSPKGMALVKRYGWRETFIMLPDDIEFHEHSIRVTARAGSVVFWDQRTMHGSRPNESPNPRYAQFFKIFPATMYSKRATARQAAIKEMIRLQDRKSGSAGMPRPISYAVFCLKKKSNCKTSSD